MIHRIYLLLFSLFLLLPFTGIAQLKPFIFLRSSPASSSYTAPVSLSFYASAYDQDGTVERVEFYLCGTKIAETDTEPYDILLKDLTAGDYCVTAKAIDNTDSSVSSYAISFTVGPAPTTCTSVPAYLENDGYTAGSKVSNHGHLYECKPWPYSGWCNGAEWAYGPGSGSAWTDAWTDLGTCAENTTPVCESTSAYEEGAAYGPGSEVSQAGVRYACKAWPFSGWCSGAAWAYAPGTGTYWQDAWIALDTCSAYSAFAKKNLTEVKATPHPFEEETTVQLESLEEIVSYELFNSQGVSLLSSTDWHQKELQLGKGLIAGYYILHLTTKNATYTKTLIKR